MISNNINQKPCTSFD